jgi:hypothetical protein
MTDTLNDDDILALAAKIKHQRELDGQYRLAFDMIKCLNHELLVGSDELRNYVSVEFFTIGVRNKHQSHKTIHLPVDSGVELIDWLLSHIDSKQYGGEQAND